MTSLSTPVTSSKLLVTPPIVFLLALVNSLDTDLPKNSGNESLVNLTLPGLTPEAVIKPLSNVAFSQVFFTKFSKSSSLSCPGPGPTL